MTSLGAKLRFLATAGVGFFADGYLNLTIGLGMFRVNTKEDPVLINFSVVPILGYLYFPGGAVSTVDGDVIKGALSLGMIVGQIAFGTLADTWGRHVIYGKELILTLFGTFMVIILPWKNFSASAVTTWVSVFRVVTGIGIGAGG